MGETDVTPQVAAVVPDTTQPAPLAVESVVPGPSVPSGEQAPDASVTASPAPVNGDDDPAVWRKRYVDSSEEGRRLYRQNQELMQKLQGTTTPPPAPPPTYSPEQLETYKVTLLQKAAMTAAQGDEAKSAEYAGNLVWIDRELRKSEFTNFSQRQNAQVAYQSLAQKVAPIFEKHKEDFQPGTDTANTAQALYRELVSVKAPSSQFEEALFSSACALLALEQTGKFTKGVTAKAGQQALQALNTTMKLAAVSQGGAANANASAPMDAKSIQNMSAAEFADYRKRIGASS